MITRIIVLIRSATLEVTNSGFFMKRTVNCSQKREKIKRRNKRERNKEEEERERERERERGRQRV